MENNMEKKENKEIEKEIKEEENTKMEEEELRKKLEKCEKEKSEYLAGWQRAKADFINYKKEEMERLGQLLKYAGEEFALKILPILDNFDLAEKQLPEDLKENENVKGLLQIKEQLLSFLKNLGVEEIKVIGEKLDPNFHEVVGEIEGGKEESGIIKEEVQKGYTIKGRLLRPAKVKVSK